MDTPGAMKTMEEERKENMAILLQMAAEAMRAAVSGSLEYHKTSGCPDTQCHMESDITRRAQGIELEFALIGLTNQENMAIELLAYLAAFSKFTLSAAASFKR